MRDVQDARPARSRARTGDWPASSASARLGGGRTSTLQAGHRLGSRGPPPVPRRTVLRFAGRRPSPASREPPAPSPWRFVLLAWTFFSFGLLLVGGRRNIVVAPAGAFKISGLIMLVLLCPLSGIIEPGVGEIVRQTAFTLCDAVDEVPELGTAPTTGGCGAGSGKGHLLAAFALEVDGGRMPLVDLAKRHFATLVVCFVALEDLHHMLLPLSPAVCSAWRSCPAAL